MFSREALEAQLECLAHLQTELEAVMANFENCCNNDQNSKIYENDYDIEVAEKSQGTQQSRNPNDRRSVPTRDPGHCYSAAAPEGQATLYLDLVRQLAHIQDDFQQMKISENSNSQQLLLEDTRKEEDTLHNVIPKQQVCTTKADQTKRNPPNSPTGDDVKSGSGVPLAASQLDFSPPKSTTTPTSDYHANKQIPFHTAPAGAASQSQEAVAKWHTEKKLRRNIEVLQNKLQEQRSIALAAEAAKVRLQEHFDRATEDLGKSEATNRDLRSKLRKAQAAAAKEGNIPATAAQSLLRELDEIQMRHDVLERKLAAVNHLNAATRLGGSCREHSSGSPPPPPPRSTSPSSPFVARHPRAWQSMHQTPSTRCSSQAQSDHLQSVHVSTEKVEDSSSRVKAELRSLDLILERDQARAQATRIQQRLDCILSAISEGVPLTNITVEGDIGSVLKHASGRGGARSSQPTRREQELLDTISLLRGALEKTRRGLEGGVSSSKYMHSVSKAKHATAQVHHLQEKLKGAEENEARLSEALREVADTKVVVSALRGHVRDLKRRAKETAETQKVIGQAKIKELERALHERDIQLAALRSAACDEVRSLLAEGITPKMLVQQLLEAR